MHEHMRNDDYWHIKWHSSGHVHPRMLMCGCCFCVVCMQYWFAWFADYVQLMLGCFRAWSEACGRLPAGTHTAARHISLPGVTGTPSTYLRSRTKAMTPTQTHTHTHTLLDTLLDILCYKPDLWLATLTGAHIFCESTIQLASSVLLCRLLSSAVIVCVCVCVCECVCVCVYRSVRLPGGSQSV